MPAQVLLSTPLAQALNAAIQPKLNELGWGSGGADDSALAEYIVLMLVNEKSQDEIAAELSGDFLNLSPDDPSAKDFAKWLFDQIDLLSSQQQSVENAAGALAAATGDGMAAAAQTDSAMDGGMDTDMNADDAIELNTYVSAFSGLSLLGPATNSLPSPPTGPKSMRNGNFRGGREKRMVGQINRVLDRNADAVLHRVRGQGNERIGRGPPTGPRMGVGRQPRVPNNRAATIAHGMATGMGGIPPGPQAVGAMNNNWMMQGQQPPPMEIFSMLEQQQLMLQQMMMQQQQQQQQQQRGGGHQRGRGKSLFDRVQRPQNNFRRGGGHQQHNGHQPNQPSDAAEAGGHIISEDVDMSQTQREPTNPEEMVCKYNLNCTNKECKFAHQSPAAPAGTTIDPNDVCTFGVACKNRKCVGRHPSPATKVAHQSEQDCKFFPHCQNPRCVFRHPSMPPCRNGGECKTPNCKFTHLKIACKFNPCTNRFCPFSHEEGQRGTFHDKVWVADESKEHVSERKFVDEKAPEDLVLPGADSEMNAEQGVSPEVVT
jgi:hypothetical protein